MLKNLKNFINDESGQSTTEYILILALVVMIAMKVKDKLGRTLEGTVDKLDGSINNAFSEIN